MALCTERPGIRPATLQPGPAEARFLVTWSPRTPRRAKAQAGQRAGGARAWDRDSAWRREERTSRLAGGRGWGEGRGAHPGRPSVCRGRRRATAASVSGLRVSGLRFGVNKAGPTWDGGPHDLRGSLRVSHSSLVEREDAPRLPLGCCPPTSVGRGQPEVGAADRSPHQSSFVPKPCGCVPQHTHTGRFCAPLWRVTHAPPGRQPQTGPPAPLYPQSLAKQLRPSHPKRQMKRVF